MGPVTEHDKEPDAPLSNRTRDERWGVDFPFEWDADDLVSRRQLLRWSVWASGALFAGTGTLAALGYARAPRRDVLRPIVGAAEVPRGGVVYFKYPGAEDHAILLRLLNGQLVAYSGKCTHLSCAVYWSPERGKLRCPCHEGLFDPATGAVLAGPPQRPLPRIALREENGIVHAVEEAP